MADDQEETCAFLRRVVAGDRPRPPAPIETHISYVFLAAERAFKLKRSVKLPYLDFSTPELRLAACRRELDLNKRTAGQLYCAVRPITRDADGELVFDGKGPLVDAVVEMRRFEQDAVFDRMAAAGLLDTHLMAGLAETIAAFHAAAPAKSGSGAQRIANVIDINARALATVTEILPAARIDRVNLACRAALLSLGPLMDRRAEHGKVRHCHGDLHLRNICLIDGKPTLFDCLEFNDALATTDVLYDLAFLVMDLWHCSLRPLANFVCNRYFDHADETDGLPLLSFFMALRAIVRAHVTATRAAGAPTPERAALAGQANAFLATAQALLQHKPSRLVAIGGLSGTGKSTLAAAIADRIGPAPGARVLSSDRIRKALFGVPVQTRLPKDAYRPEISEKVYARLFSTALTTLKTGHGVVTDAVFDRQADRDHIRAVADGLQVPFQGLWLEASSDILLHRVALRRADPSDAGVDVVRAQLAHNLPVTDWPHVQSDTARNELEATAARLLDLDAGCNSNRA